MTSTTPSAVSRKAPGSYHHGDLRRALLDAAIALIAKRGVAGLSLAELCRSAGVSQAAFYRHFEGRDHLLANAVQEGCEKLAALIDERLLSGHERSTLFKEALRTYLDFAISHPGYFTVMFSKALLDEMRVQAEVAEGSATDMAIQQARAAAERTFHALLRALGPALPAGCATNTDETLSLLTDTASLSPAEHIVGAFWALAHGVAVLWTGHVLKPAWGENEFTPVLDQVLNPWLRGMGLETEGK